VSLFSLAIFTCDSAWRKVLCAFDTNALFQNICSAKILLKGGGGKGTKFLEVYLIENTVQNVRFEVLTV
jgi:hypothetical protein